MKLTFIYHNVPYSILIKTLYWEFHGTCLRGVFWKRDSLVDVKNKLIN